MDACGLGEWFCQIAGGAQENPWRVIDTVRGKMFTDDEHFIHGDS